LDKFGGLLPVEVRWLMKSIEVVEIIGFTPAMVKIIWILNKREKFLMHKKPKGIRE
jgi:hypothetical protein